MAIREEPITFTVNSEIKTYNYTNKC